jgi:uncharacterized tellurite resistance protein B-like protein
VQEFDLKLAKTISLIEESELFEDTSEICQGFKESHLLFLTSYFGITVAVAVADGKLFESEVDYIANGIPQSIKLSEEIKSSLVELNLSKALLANGYSVTIPHYISYLKKVMSEDDIIKIVKLLFFLGCADGNLSQEEEKLIIQMSRRFGLSDGKIKQIRDYSLKSKIEKLKVDKEVTFLKKAKSLEQVFDKKRFLNNLSDEDAMDFDLRLKQSPLYFSIKQICSTIKLEDLLFITSYLGTAFSLIASDGDIHEKEVSYIRSQFTLWYALEEDTINTLFDISIYLTEKKAHTEAYNLIYTEILSKLFDKQEKETFTIMLLNLAEKDDNISPLELLIVDKISETFDFDNETLANLKNQANGIDGSFKIIKSASSWDMLKK